MEGRCFTFCFSNGKFVKEREIPKNVVWIITYRISEEKRENEIQKHYEYQIKKRRQKRGNRYLRHKSKANETAKNFHSFAR